MSRFDTVADTFAKEANFQLAPAKYHFRQVKELNVGMKCDNRLALTMGGVVPRDLDDVEGLQSADYSVYQIVERNDLLFKLIDLENIKTSRVGHVPERGIVSPAYIRAIATSKNIETRYYYWYYYAAYLNNVFNGMGAGVRQTLGSDELLGALVPIPSSAEQVLIANFLDVQTARIDALIAEKTALIARLLEMAESTIAARILGENVPGKRQCTNVVEVGTIPQHWRLTPMMRLTDPERPIMYGIVLPGPNIEEGPSVPIIKGGDVRPHRLKLELLNRTTPEIEAPYARARLAEGDIVYSIRGTIGDAELVPGELAGANITQDVARIAPRVGITPKWLLYAAKSRPVFAQLEQLSLGAAVKGINIFDLKRARVPTPPPEEQTRIATELEALTVRLAALRHHSLDHIIRLREYRSSLISAAVTGQLDINAYKAAA